MMTQADFLDIATPGAASSRGAPMGRSNYGFRDEASRNHARKFHLRKIPLDTGGYDPGGAYWGHSLVGESVYCAIADGCVREDDDVEIQPARLFIRARSRDHAKRDVLDLFPNARFYDGLRGPAVPDRRYSIRLEYTGQPEPVYVVRFCGDWLGWAPTLRAAEDIADRHAEKRARGLSCPS